jgi:DHA1 family multidrug resistance protein-like MFS transporter/DHA1 family quinolone resistance protein-like MFS transporter
MSILDRFGIRPAIRRALAAPISKTHVLLPAAFLVAFGLNILTFGIVFFMADTYGSPPGEIGSLMALWSLSYFAGCFLLRPLGRRLQPRFSMMLATAALALCLTALVLAGSKGLTFVFYALAGLSNSLFFPPLMTWLASGIDGRELNSALSRFSLSWSLGGVVSPYPAGFLVEHGPVYPLLACIVCLVVTFLVIGLASITVRGMRVPTGPEVNGLPIEPVDRSTPLRYPAWMGNFSVYVLMGIISAVFPLFARGELGFAESTIGLIFLSRAVLVTTGFVLFGRLTCWHFRRHYQFGLQLVFTVFTLGLFFVESGTAYFILLPLQGLFLAAFYSSSMFHGASGAVERQKRMAVHEGMLTAGLIIGSVAGGLLYQRYSMRTVFLLSLSVAASVAVAQTLLLGLTKNRRESRI